MPDTRYPGCVAPRRGDRRLCDVRLPELSCRGPAAHPLVGEDLPATYRRLGEAVVAACGALGVSGHLVRPDEARARPTPVALRPCCYGGISPYEVLVGARKLIGVAQVRRFGAAAYVGGLYRAFDPAEQRVCLAGEVALRRERAYQLAAATTDLAAVGRPDALDQFPMALTTALAERQGLIPTPGEFTDAEQARAARLTAEQYARDEWTLRICDGVDGPAACLGEKSATAFPRTGHDAGGYNVTASLPIAP